MDKDLIAWSALAQIKGLGPERLATLARALDEKSMRAGDLLGASSITLRELGLSVRFTESAEVALRNPPTPTTPQGIQVIHPNHPDYPHHRLDHVAIPAVLYSIGNLSLLGVRSIAMSGSRKTSRKPLEFAEELASACASQGWNVVAGNAKGIDQAGHISALKAEGTTTMVLAEGLLAFKPEAWWPRNSWVAVSEFDVDAKWQASRAMKRNATIAGLSEAVVVVAAPLKGGSWAQAHFCLEHNIPVWVVDFSEDLAEGNRQLIRAGAIPLEPSDPASILRSLDQERVQHSSQDALFPSNLEG